MNLDIFIVHKYKSTLWTVNDVTGKDPLGSLQLLWWHFTRKDPSNFNLQLLRGLSRWNVPTEAVKTPRDLYRGYFPLTSLTVHRAHFKRFYYQILTFAGVTIFFSQIEIPVHYGIHYRVGTGKNVQKLFNSHINVRKGTFVSHEPWKRQILFNPFIYKKEKKLWIVWYFTRLNPNK